MPVDIYTYWICSLETMHDWYLPTFSIISLPVICKRAGGLRTAVMKWRYDVRLPLSADENARLKKTKRRKDKHKHKKQLNWVYTIRNVVLDSFSSAASPTTSYVCVRSTGIGIVSEHWLTSHDEWLTGHHWRYIIYIGILLWNCRRSRLWRNGTGSSSSGSDRRRWRAHPKCR